MTRALSIVLLTGIWIVAWRELSVANLLGGVVVSTGVTLLLEERSDRRFHHVVHPVAALSYIAWFSVKLVQSNLVLAREVVTPTNRIRTGVIRVPLPGCSDLVATIVANSVSLTPGTLTVELDRGPVPVLAVHVLHLHDIDAAREDVRDLTRRVLAACTPRDLAPNPEDAL